MKDKIDKRIRIAEKRVEELIKEDCLKKLSETSQHSIAKFYETKSINRLETAKLVYRASKNPENKEINSLSKDYIDYAESVAAAYYAMYYIVHAYLAKKYGIKLREDLRGVHTITLHLVLYYLVKTKKLAQHLYEEYKNAFETTEQIQAMDIEHFQEEAYKYAEKYDKNRDARENFTYNVTPNAEAYHAEQAINNAEEFISTIRQLMLR